MQKKEKFLSEELHQDCDFNEFIILKQAGTLQRQIIN